MDWCSRWRIGLHIQLACCRCDLPSNLQCQFSYRKQIPQQVCSYDGEKLLKHGRPLGQERRETFMKAASYWEEIYGEQITILDLITIMWGVIRGTISTPYGPTYMKIKLKEHYGNDNVITELNGKSNVITVRTTTESVLYSFMNKRR